MNKNKKWHTSIYIPVLEWSCNNSIFLFLTLLKVGGNAGMGAVNPGSTLPANNSLFNSSNSIKLLQFSSAIKEIIFDRNSFFDKGWWCEYSNSSSLESLLLSSYWDTGFPGDPRPKGKQIKKKIERQEDI